MRKLLALFLAIALALTTTLPVSAAGLVPAVNSDMGCTISGQLLYYNGSALACESDPGSGGNFPVIFSPGVLTATSATYSTFYKVVKAGTVQNLIGSALTLIGTSVIITLYDCGASATCVSPTTIGSVTVSATGTATVGTISNSAVAAGDYLAYNTSGTITSADVQATAMVQQN